MTDTYYQYSIGSFWDGDFFTYAVQINNEGKIVDYVNMIFPHAQWETTYCPHKGEKISKYEKRIGENKNDSVSRYKISKEIFLSAKNTTNTENKVKENLKMTQFIYINPAMVNPKTKENVRKAEMEKLKALKEQGFTIIGLEMTVPPLAELCDRNIDPQHTDGRADHSCIKEVCQNAPKLLGWFKGKDLDKVIFVTNRVDVDALGAYVLADRYLKGEKVSLNENIAAINAHDTHLGAKWEGPKEIEQAFDPDNKVAALASSVKVFAVTEKNIEDVKTFIDTGNVEETVMNNYRTVQTGIIDKVKSGEIKTEVIGGVAYVETSLPCATNVGYSFAPVVVAINPQMRNPDGTTYRKVSICQHEAGYADLVAIKNELSQKETGWGGSPTFIGSPQGQDCQAELSDIKKLVYANLTPEYKAHVSSQNANNNSEKVMGE